jgi:tetrahydromethanopterin S-methyltransferase subunit C
MHQTEAYFYINGEISGLAIQKNMMGPVVTPILGAVALMVIGAVLSLTTSIFTRRSHEAKPA